MEVKTKINKWDLIKLKSFCIAKETINKVKTTLRMGENNSKWNNWQRINFQNIQAAHTSQYQKNKQPNQKVGKRPNRHFSKDIQMANKYMKRCSTLLIIREMQIKTTMRYHLTPFRTVIIKKSTNNKWGRGCGEKGILLHCWWECKLIQPLWKMVWRLLLKSRNKITIWPSNPTTRYIPWGNQNWKRQCTPMFIATLFTIARTWKQPRCPSTDEWIKKLWHIYTMEYYSAIKGMHLNPF